MRTCETHTHAKTASSVESHTPAWWARERDQRCPGTSANSRRRGPPRSRRRRTRRRRNTTRSTRSIFFSRHSPQRESSLSHRREKRPRTLPQRPPPPVPRRLPVKWASVRRLKPCLDRSGVSSRYGIVYFTRVRRRRETGRRGGETDWRGGDIAGALSLFVSVSRSRSLFDSDVTRAILPPTDSVLF